MALSEQPIVIQLSKTKLTLLLLGSLIFVVIGILFVTNPDEYTSFRMRNSSIIFIAGFAGIIFFGLSFLFISKKLTDNSPGLIISSEGILDNSSVISPTQIKWLEIEDISVKEIYGQKYILLNIKKSTYFISKQKGSFKRWLMTKNYKTYGSPINITSNGLKISHIKLLSILKEKLNEERQRLIENKESRA